MNRIKELSKIYYVGKNNATGATCAIKQIKKDKLTRTLTAALKQEIDLLKSITNDNVVRLHDVQKTQNHFYLIMEYCGGGDLRTYLKKKGGRLEEYEVQKIIYELSNGFKVLCERKIVHRDIKLSNLLVSSKGKDAVVKLADFGFARYSLYIYIYI